MVCSRVARAISIEEVSIFENSGTTLCDSAVLRRAVPTDILHFAARVVVTSARLKRPIIVSIPSTARPQHDHRLRHLVQRTGDMTIATDLGVPRSTARGWLGAAPTVVGLSECGADLTEPELRQEVLKLRRRVQKLTALLRLALALLRTSGFRLTGARRISPPGSPNMCVTLASRSVRASVCPQVTAAAVMVAGSKTRARAATANWS